MITVAAALYVLLSEAEMERIVAWKDGAMRLARVRVDHRVLEELGLDVAAARALSGARGGGGGGRAVAQQRVRRRGAYRDAASRQQGGVGSRGLHLRHAGRGKGGVYEFVQNVVEKKKVFWIYRLYFSFRIHLDYGIYGYPGTLWVTIPVLLCTRDHGTLSVRYGRVLLCTGYP